MHILTDKNGNEAGYLYHNVILLPGNIVSGVILAHCVFTRNGTVKGKYFRGFMYNENGEIIAKEISGDSEEITAAQGKAIMVDAWTILSRTTDHICPWVVATDEWSATPLKEFLDQ